MTLHCELAAGAANTPADAVAATIRQVCNLRGEVVFVPAGTLVNDGKVIDDLRPIEA
jgi:phenylacetate-CoA ligase